MTVPLEQLKKCWFLTGPTASGKTATALHLAEQLDAEILSLDSMAIYRHMDIGTAKASAEERAQIPHHLIDLIEPHETFSVTDYIQHAEAAISDILGRGKVPLFIGGTGLYLRSLLRGVFNGPDADWDFRNAQDEFLSQYGNAALHDRLKNVDAATANRLHPNDTRRIIRALEVYQLTGQPLSQQQNHNPLPLDKRPAAVVWLESDVNWLVERIHHRVDMMMEQGLLKETQALMNQDPAPGRTARQALGYREILQHLEDGEPLEACVLQIKIGTRQFAKRQRTWFRNMEECLSVKRKTDESAEQLAERLLQMFNKPSPKSEPEND
ncbi:MAG: tRNA (adenosine(37)-N6)-dimethylallyltransferase MiaA [Fuerstiella sp.]